ncbi:hypothetical protein B7755_052130 [Streptomyces sp. NBS 14/10]|uniref:hypothetical protein n=1 Tax=Streptomyces sp. NBS 14/10 TaxID=1945643 RepID=UPI000B7F91F6|nr:hypothetical protein [Streptomyces sp. NBS 14/10]KAK1176698.1 hypothetical protein B7755_052130 [Streptomyces sp. NBS 14/10]
MNATALPICFGTPTPPALPTSPPPPYAGLLDVVKREEDDDNDRGYEDEPEATAAFARSVQAAIGAIAAGVLPHCGDMTHCGRPMIHEGGGRYVCAKPGCGATFDTGRAARETAPAVAESEIGSGFCSNCGQGVSTLNGRYTCLTCGNNG